MTGIALEYLVTGKNYRGMGLTLITLIGLGFLVPSEWDKFHLFVKHFPSAISSVLLWSHIISIIRLSQEMPCVTIDLDNISLTVM